jgi:hypothetical protein
MTPPLRITRARTQHLRRVKEIPDLMAGRGRFQSHGWQGDKNLNF